MDLEERTREFFAALGAGPASAVLAFLAPDAIFEVSGLLPPIGLDKLDPMLRRAYSPKPPVTVRLDAMKVKRNVAFAGWTATGDIPGGGPGEMEGLAVIAWDQRGKVVRLDIHLGPEAAKRLKP